MTRRVLHADFNRRELAAILKLLEFGGHRPSCLDIPLADQIITTIPSKDDARHFASSISWICELDQLLPFSPNNVEASFTEIHEVEKLYGSRAMPYPSSRGQFPGVFFSRAAEWKEPCFSIS